MSVTEDLMNEFDMKMTLQTSRRYEDEIEGNTTKTSPPLLIKPSFEHLIRNILNQWQCLRKILPLEY